MATMREIFEAVGGGKFAVTMSETGGAEIVDARNHAEALKKVNPVMSYSDTEWPEYDKVSVSKKGSTFKQATDTDSGPAHFLKKYSRKGSRDYPLWDEEAGPVMVWDNPKFSQAVYVYPVKE